MVTSELPGQPCALKFEHAVLVNTCDVVENISLCYLIAFLSQACCPHWLKISHGRVSGYVDTLY